MAENNLFISAHDYFVLFQHVQKKFAEHFFLREDLTLKNKVEILIWHFGNGWKNLVQKSIVSLLLA